MSGTVHFKNALVNPIFNKVSKAASRLNLESYVIGGFVRDYILKRGDAKDVDIVAVGSGIDLAKEVSQLLPGKPKVSIFKNYGTAMLKSGGIELEFVGARKESYQKESRKPAVENGTLEDDQNRRDFTINALALSLNPQSFGKLLDPFNGVQDLKNKIIRTPLDPNITYRDDPLRMLRAIRFATQLNFKIEKESLAAITGNADLLEMEFPGDDKIKRYVTPMKESAHQMAHLTSQLLAYARGGKYNPEITSPTDLVKETLPLIEHTVDPDIRIETDLPSDIMSIKADSAQMQMVLSAIISNSNDAIEDTGRITISARNVEIDEDFVKVYPALKPGQYVSITFEDDGKGMDEETKDRIFEPFFTTHFMVRGLGMAAAYGIIRNHDGWITVDSELGKGTRVVIYLPAADVKVKEEKKPESDVVSGTGTVLLVEDEETVFDVTQAMLERLGYRVMAAKTGKDAIHITETFDGDIDLALLDIKLPDIEGGKVYQLIMEARPDLKVIVFSGYTIDGPARKILDAGAQDFIQKPFSLATLSEKLKKVLGEG